MHLTARNAKGTKSFYARTQYTKQTTQAARTEARPGWRTTVSLAWLSERLAMGHYTRVSQAVDNVKREPDRRQKQSARGGGAEHPKV